MSQNLQSESKTVCRWLSSDLDPPSKHAQGREGSIIANEWNTILWLWTVVTWSPLVFIYLWTFLKPQENRHK